MSVKIHRRNPAQAVQNMVPEDLIRKHVSLKMRFFCGPHWLQFTKIGKFQPN